MNAPILIAEDDAATRVLCQSVLSDAGYTVLTAQSCLQVKQRLAQGGIGAVLLDVGLPDGSGLGVLSSIPPHTAVIIMTVQDGPEQRAEGLRLGAMDYLVKPFHPDELLWRLRRAIDSLTTIPTTAPKTATWQGYRLEQQRRELCAPTGETVRLTEGETQILGVLLARDSAVSIDVLTDAISEGVGNQRSVTVLISRLRRKFRDNGGFQGLEIRPVHGFGYALDCNEIP